MLNQLSKKILFSSKPFLNHKSFKITKNSKSLFLHKIQYHFFNQNGKYDLNKDYYAILGIDKNADQSTIKKQYYKLAKQYHPDVNSQANQKFKLINQAYGVLSDQKLKSQYDQQRQSSQAQQRFYQKRNQYQQQSDYRAKYYQQYRKAYQQMDQYDRYLIRKQFTRYMIRVFLFGFAFSLLFTILFPPRRILIDQFGRPVDIHGRPVDMYGKPKVYNTLPQQMPIYDPYNLAGSPRTNYPQQSVYGQQYTSGAQQQSGQQGYY